MAYNNRYNVMIAIILMILVVIFTVFASYGFVQLATRTERLALVERQEQKINQLKELLSKQRLTIENFREGVRELTVLNDKVIEDFIGKDQLVEMKKKVSVPRKIEKGRRN